MIEGGAEILSSVLREGLFDRFTVYYAPVVVGGATAPPVAAGPDADPPEATVRLRLVTLDRLGEGYVVTYTPFPPVASVIPDGGSSRSVSPP